MAKESFGKIFSYPNNPRVFKALIAAQYNDLVVDVVHVELCKDTKTSEFMAKNPLAKVPFFEGADGFTLFESEAIAAYVANAKEGTKLFGNGKKDAGLVRQYVEMANNEFNPVTAAWVYPILGYFPVDEAATQKAKTDCKRALEALNKILLTKTFLVGESVTVADISMACALLSLFSNVLDSSFMATYKNVVRYFNTCINQREFKAVLGEVVLCTKMKVAKKVVAKNEEAPKPKKVAPKVEKKEDEEDLEAIAAKEAAGPKEKNPLDLLPKSSMVLDEWKRTYSNNDTRPNALDWLWANFDSKGYSIWKVDYKYNDELTQVFMSSNLVGGFYQRLDRARKYAFGSMCILGEDKNNVITGYFIFRGHAVPFEVTDAADYPSYTFTRVDDKNPEVRKNVDAVFAWDDTIAGKKFADGKIFK